MPSHYVEEDLALGSGFPPLQDPFRPGGDRDVVFTSPATREMLESPDFFNEIERSESFTQDPNAKGSTVRDSTAAQDGNTVENPISIDDSVDSDHEAAQDDTGGVYVVEYDSDNDDLIDNESLADYPAPLLVEGNFNPLSYPDIPEEGLDCGVAEFVAIGRRNTEYFKAFLERAQKAGQYDPVTRTMNPLALLGERKLDWGAPGNGVFSGEDLNDA